MTTSKLTYRRFVVETFSPLLISREAAPFYGMEPHHGEDGSPIFDSLDVDLFVKVLANTAFSETYLPISAAVINHSLGPFFVFFIPIFYIIQGANLTDPIVIACSIYYAFISAFCRSRSPAYRFL
jgi:hypothetical protein